eukprot:CAMPEP_0113881452 /NCGR_PEP_ID=MMETSP0780_2-20120614/8385_1 /TAXON_ID=652834 /ORGANISM="Palpitomonas bilix" /LENGTH=49 /DNA_ID=CAMNT_0000868313 /DNA_START=169 /DNA_END=318 /DNA_ORIENTATION=+ /assembly_acc=CAM_ASM_000599
MVAGAAIATICYGVFNLSIEKEERPQSPAHSIPSQRWYKPGKFGAAKEI